MSEPVYFIVQTRTVYHEGDERSKRYPGHGYPAHTEEFSEVTKFDSYINFCDKVIQLTKANAKFEIYRATEMFVETKFEVKLVER